MDYSRPDRADRLAAEYALGTLRGPARRRFENLLGAHPALRDALEAWHQRLQPLAGSLSEVQPSDRVWQGIQAQLFSGQPLLGAAALHDAATLDAAQPWWRRLGWWRGASALATSCALALAVVLNQTPPAQAPLVIVLSANPGAAQAVPADFKASFVASVSPDGRALVLRPINDVALTAGRALELWAVPAQGAPRSLGLVQAAGSTTLLRAGLLRDTAAFAVSIEPGGGSPTGAPTGPIVSLGKLQI